MTSIKDYAHEIIGFHEYSGATSLQNQALRLYLGVGNSANLCGLRSEMAWLEPRSRTQLKMQYSDLRQHLYSSIPIPNFEQLNDNNKFICMLTHDSVARLVGQYIVKAFDVRICR